MSAEREALVLLPGFLCDQSYWQDQIDALSDVAACSCAEYGMLNSLPAMAESVLRSAPQRFSLAGHSMGGRIALEVFRQAPDRVKRIALFNTGATPRAAGAVGEEEERGRRGLLAIAQSQGMRAMALKWIPNMVAPARRSDSVLTEAIVQMFERKNPQIFEAQMTALLGRPDAVPLLAQINCPTLVLTGQDDAWSTPATHQQIAAAIAHSRLVLVPGSGHMSTMERPAEVAEAVRAWLAVAV